ncbi:MAG: COX15/CtaA family protein [Bdellovibrionales bacterium]|nr:COX15/CtaA family protein [Bdellovibrionales bacterium]
MFSWSKEIFKKYSLFSLLFTLSVILWGAWVRFSHSGDGCGNDWPLCKGRLTPDSFSALMEWIHRATSGLSLLIIFALVFLAFKIYPKKHLMRKLALAAGLLILVEALIGAVLVLASLTGSDSSNLRVAVLAFHLINSLLLVAVLTLCWQNAFSERITVKKPHIYFVCIFPILALTGSIASLAGTLFPSESLIQSFLLDFLPESHITLKLRPLHPLLALGFAAFCLIAFAEKKKALAGMALIAVCSGIATLIFLSPTWLKLSHLFIAYTFWIVLVKNTFDGHPNHKKTFP